MSEALARKEGHLGHITLNRPEAINALTLGMVREINVALTAWEADDTVGFILMDGAGEKGFCAGGDIRALYDAAIESRFEDPAQFFREEYHLNCKIARYPKPIIAIMDGTVMGGGIGLGGHSSHRIVTERSVLAMPETRIGFFPDVGGTYLLSVTPGEVGTHIALTAGRMKGSDAILVGLADRYVPSERLPEMQEALSETHSLKGMRLIIDRFAAHPTESRFAAARPWIDRCYAGDDAEAIVAALQAAPEPDAQKAAAEIIGNSPTSVKVSLEALRRARRLGRLEECLDQEFRLASTTIRNRDFVEGVRAAVVDKDRNPKWNPPRLEDITQAEVDRHFMPLGAAELGLAQS